MNEFDQNIAVINEYIDKTKEEVNKLENRPLQIAKESLFDHQPLKEIKLEPENFKNKKLVCPKVHEAYLKNLDEQTSENDILEYPINLKCLEANENFKQRFMKKFDEEKELDEYHGGDKTDLKKRVNNIMGDVDRRLHVLKNSRLK